MASRCINALNELDSISDKIFNKYSKNRLKQEIANKVRESKSRAERNAQSAFPGANCTSRKSNQQIHSSHPSTAKTNRVKASRIKSHSDIKTPKNQNEQHKSKSFSHQKLNRTKSEDSSALNEDNACEIRNSCSPSIYGKYTPGAKTHKTGNWFNLKDGVDHGVIDSFACDKLNEKALCYQVDVKESKTVPKLLRHRLEVRIGRNGDVKNEDAGMKNDVCSSTRISSSTTGIRTAPLSWEEQLNWENTRIITPSWTHHPQKKTDEDLNQTHPVIFHPEENYQRLSQTTTTSNKASVSYRLYMDKKLVSDRRNLTCGRKCVTSVEIEEASHDVSNDHRCTVGRTKSHDSDLMDMSNTIKNIERIYNTPSEQEISRKIPLETTADMVEKPVTEAVVENPIGNEKIQCDDDQLENEEVEKSKMNKKVSFKEEIPENDFLKSDQNTNQENVEGKVEAGSKTVKPTIKRPTSSRVQSSINIEEFKVDKVRRPYTAPHSTPRTKGSKSPDESIATVEKQSVNLKALSPIRVPTSTEILSETENDLKEDKREYPLTADKVHNIQVTISCKSRSAPNLHTAQQEEQLARSQSTTSARVKTEKCSPHRTIAVMDYSDLMELPSNVPPGQALIELRKKIRENLAKETADLQLDIQQLYLKHHSYQN